MVSDEEILERAFFSALQKHFKKPSPWFTETVKDPTTQGWKCPVGQVWEIFVCNNVGIGGFLINDKMCTNSSVIIDEWYPQTARTDYLIDITGEIGNPGGGDTSLTGNISHIMVSMATEGWLLSDNETIKNSLNEFLLRKRRRFDLET